MKHLLTFLLCLTLTSGMANGQTASPPQEKATEQSETKKSKKIKEPSAKSRALAESLSPLQNSRLLSILNRGDDNELSSLPGIGAGRAKAIKESRPYQVPIDLLRVAGIGDSTFAAIVDYAKADFKVMPTKPKGFKKRTTGASSAAQVAP